MPELSQPRYPSSKVVVSDLHLGDGRPETENWVASQQAAWERLLAVAAAAPEAELIVNGDCFDFLATTPALDDRDDTDPEVGVAKMERIITAHTAWFGSLHAFLSAPGRAVTFLIGNHDLELAFPAVRAVVRAAIAAPPETVRFCLARAYRPVPDVEIEHGCQFDPWNVIPTLWDQSSPSTSAAPDELEARDTSADGGPTRLELPFGSRYYYRVFTAIQRQFPYFDAFLPSLPQAGILAALCLYAPDLIVAGSRQTRALYADPPSSSPSVTDLERAARLGPAALFDAIIPDVAALQAQVWRRAGVPLGAADADGGAAYFEAVSSGLARDEQTALRAIVATPGREEPGPHALDVAAASTMLARAPALRVALCGHTHQEGVYPLGASGGPRRTFVNTGTWFSRVALPTPDAISPAIAAWLREPRAGPSPLPSASAFTYAVLTAQPGAPTTITAHTAL